MQFSILSLILTTSLVLCTTAFAAEMVAEERESIFIGNPVNVEEVSPPEEIVYSFNSASLSGYTSSSPTSYSGSFQGSSPFNIPSYGITENVVDSFRGNTGGEVATNSLSNVNIGSTDSPYKDRHVAPAGDYASLKNTKKQADEESISSSANHVIRKFNY